MEHIFSSSLPFKLSGMIIKTVSQVLWLQSQPSTREVGNHNFFLASPAAQEWPHDLGSTNQMYMQRMQVLDISSRH